MPGAAKTILLIDDEPNLIEGLARTLAHEGYAILTAQDGATGLALARERRPDVIVCDVSMPPPDGITLRRMLGADPGTASIPFIFLTAHGDAATRIGGLDAGADDYVVKPAHIDEMLARIRAVLRGRERGRQAGRAEVEVEIARLRLEIARNVSHELRTPLTVVLGTLELVLDGRFAGRADEQRSFIAHALGSAQQLHALIEDLIALGAIDRGEVGESSPVDLVAAVQRAAETCRTRRPERRALVEIDAPDALWIAAPPAGLDLALRHLLDNAVRFGPVDGFVFVRVRAEGDASIVEVRDEGPGVPLSEREHVFERFVQLGTSAARTGGSGLGVGLTIARAFARSRGGDVTMLDTPRGCRVRLTLTPPA